MERSTGLRETAKIEIVPANGCMEGVARRTPPGSKVGEQSRVGAAIYCIFRRSTLLSRWRSQRSEPSFQYNLAGSGSSRASADFTLFRASNLYCFLDRY